jgi:hypothetical protein
MKERSINWSGSAGACTTAARVMADNKGGLAGSVGRRAREAVCLVYRDALCPQLKEIDAVVKTVNCVQTRPWKA